jgi:hypothetical protein
MAAALATADNFGFCRSTMTLLLSQDTQALTLSPSSTGATESLPGACSEFFSGALRFPLCHSIDIKCISRGDGAKPRSPGRVSLRSPVRLKLRSQPGSGRRPCKHVRQNRGYMEHYSSRSTHDFNGLVNCCCNTQTGKWASILTRQVNYAVSYIVCCSRSYIIVERAVCLFPHAAANLFRDVKFRLYE